MKFFEIWCQNNMKNNKKSENCHIHCERLGWNLNHLFYALEKNRQLAHFFINCTNSSHQLDWKWSNIFDKLFPVGYHYKCPGLYKNESIRYWWIFQKVLTQYQIIFLMSGIKSISLRHSKHRCCVSRVHLCVIYANIWKYTLIYEYIRRYTN